MSPLGCLRQQNSTRRLSDAALNFLHTEPIATVEPETAHLRKPATTTDSLEMKDQVDRADGLASEGLWREPTECPQRFKTSGHVSQRVGMQRASSPVVTGVQRRQEFAHLGTATFAKHEAVGMKPVALSP